MFKSRDVIGIELSTINLKIAHASSVMPSRIAMSNVISRNIRGLSDEDISTAIRESFDQMRVKNPIVISVLPSQLGIARNMEIPSVDPEEIDGIVNLQASRHTPYSREDIIIGYIRIGIHKANQTKVLIVVVGRDKVRRQLDILEGAGVSPEKVVFGPEVITRTYARISKSKSPDSPAGIIHIDGASTDFIIALGNIPMFIRNIPIGIQHLTSERGNYKIQFTDEIRRSLKVYQEEGIGKDPGKLVFLRAADDIGDLKATLDNTLQMPTEIATYSDSRYLAISDRASKAVIADRNVSFLNLVASLFAYKEAEVDFIPEDVKARRSFEEQTRDIIKTGVFVIVLFSLVTAILFSNIWFKNAHLEKLISKYQPIIAEARTLERDFRRVALAKKYLSSEGYSLEILIELYNLIPDELCLNDIRFERGGTLSIRGISKSMRTVFGFVDSLNESRYFKNVKTRHTTKGRRGDKEVVDFEIACVCEQMTGAIDND